jgi:hypothetical protein
MPFFFCKESEVVELEAVGTEDEEEQEPAIGEGLCIYHGGCTDGVTAAWCVWKAHPQWNFYPGVYQQPPPMGLIAAASEVVFVDFTYKLTVMEEILEVNPRVAVYDHHKTAEKDLEPLFSSGRIIGEFDMGRCGAMIAWDVFKPLGEVPAPKLLELIDAQDRWLPSRDVEVTSALRSYPHESKSWARLMEVWSEFMTSDSVDRLKKQGKHIYRYYRNRVVELKQKAYTITIGPYFLVPCVNAPYAFASDVAGELAKDDPDGTAIAAVWWREPNGAITFSLRSQGDVDVGALATSWGGGGHPGAAGFQITGNQAKAFLILDAVLDDSQLEEVGRYGLLPLASPPG